MNVLFIKYYTRSTIFCQFLKKQEVKKFQPVLESYLAISQKMISVSAKLNKKDFFSKNVLFGELMFPNPNVSDIQ